MAKIPLGELDRYQDETLVEKIKKKPTKEADKKHKKTKREKQINWNEISE